MVPDSPADDPAARTEESGLAADGVLTALYGSHPRTRILVALLTEDWHDLPVSKIANLADLHRSTVYEHIGPLVDLGVIRKRDVGNVACYRINRDSELAKLVKRTEEAVLDRESGGDPAPPGDSTDSL